MNDRVRGPDSECLPSRHWAEGVVQGLLESAGSAERSGALAHRAAVRAHWIGAQGILVPEPEETGGRAAVEQEGVVEVSPGHVVDEVADVPFCAGSGRRPLFGLYRAQVHCSGSTAHSLRVNSEPASR